MNGNVHAGFASSGWGSSTVRKLTASASSDWNVVFGRSKEVLGTEVEPKVTTFLAERGLELSAEKTRLTDIDTGFDFLGQNVRKYNGKLLIKPSKKSIKALLKKVRMLIKSQRHLSAGQLITKLNPIIRGWANFHRHVVSKKTFSYIDYQIGQALWRWAKRRHRNKGAGWILTRYFRPKNKQHSGFYGQVKRKDGTKQTIRLVSAARIPITRHVKIKTTANPFDPKWERYFEKRLETKMMADFKGNRLMLHLWQSQQGICPVCKDVITEESGWENHHIIYRVNGGANTLDNRVLLHPTCHKQVHSLNLSVLKPRPITGRL